jgi:hypothetical protein
MMEAWIDSKKMDALLYEAEGAKGALDEARFSRDMHPGYLEYHGLQARPGEMEALDLAVERAAARLAGIRAAMDSLLDDAWAAFRAYEAMEH